MCVCIVFHAIHSSMLNEIHHHLFKAPLFIYAQPWNGRTKTGLMDSSFAPHSSALAKCTGLTSLCRLTFKDLIPLGDWGDGESQQRKEALVLTSLPGSQTPAQWRLLHCPPRIRSVFQWVRTTSSEEALEKRRVNSEVLTTCCSNCVCISFLFQLQAQAFTHRVHRPRCSRDRRSALSVVSL